MDGFGDGATRQHRPSPSREVMGVSGIPDIYSICIRSVGPWMNKFGGGTDVNREKDEMHGVRSPVFFLTLSSFTCQFA